MIGLGPREQYPFVPRGSFKKRSVALEYRKNRVAPKGQWCLSLPRFGINNAGQKNKTRKKIGRKLSREVFAVSINKTRIILGTDGHSSVPHTIRQGNVVVKLCDKAGHI